MTRRIGSVTQEAGIEMVERRPKESDVVKKVRAIAKGNFSDFGEKSPSRWRKVSWIRKLVASFLRRFGKIDKVEENLDKFFRDNMTKLVPMDADLLLNVQRSLKLRGSKSATHLSMALIFKTPYASPGFTASVAGDYPEFKDLDPYEIREKLSKLTTA